MRRRTALMEFRELSDGSVCERITQHATWARARECLKRLAEREGVKPGDVDDELTIDEAIPHPTIPGALVDNMRLHAYITTCM